MKAADDGAPKVFMAGTYWKRQQKFKVIKFLGGKCIRCGFSDWRALQVDHVNGGGSHESTNSYEFLSRVLQEGAKEFQLLCANCNSIKRIENGEGCRKDLNQDFLSAMEKHSEKEEIVISLC